MGGPEIQTAEALEAHQLERLRELIAELVGHNAFYGPRLAAAGLTADVPSLDDFAARMPFTTKPELAADQQADPPYGTNLTAPLESYTRVHQTSSTTGSPLRWPDTERNWSWMIDGWLQVFAAAGLGPADRVFLAFSFGPFIAAWLAFDAAERMGCLAIPGGGLSSEQRAHAIHDHHATAMVCTPTYAVRLGEVARAEGLDLAGAGLRTIIVGGEPGASVPAFRRRVEELWPGVRLDDHHGMTETGAVTFQCPERAGVLHALEDLFLCEVVDPESGAPVSPDHDEPGELVLTTLGRFDSPVLRYRTRDLVRARRGPCACGRNGLRFEGGILARTDDMIVVRGVNLFPTAVDEVVRGFDRVAEYRVEVDQSGALTEIRVVVEPHNNDQPIEPLCRELEHAFRSAWNLRIPVVAAAPGELPRFELKAKRWVRV
ncbi:MAG: AMP-binding protein [Planctomycetota bacterium]|nr:AMP-binding protein [Planctomycetota bacterium]